MKLTDQKNQDILDAAIEEFRVKGFTAARVDSIAKMANVSKRTLYNHFASKQVLFDAIIEIIMAEAATVETPKYDPSHPLDAQLVAALNSYVKLITDPVYLSLNRLLAAEYMRDQDMAQRILSRTELYVSPVSQMLKQAMQAGHLRQADPDFAAGQIVALVKNYYFWPQFMLGSAPTTDDFPMIDCVKMFLKHYAPSK